ncbi:MAG TPA: HAD hydrolase-like protein [Bacillota bacterium]|nr:HAD hydrolase-like protein [Bacillota bacterium]
MNQHTDRLIDHKERTHSPSHWVRTRFFPDMRVPSPDVIDFREIADRGFRVVLLDIDNTLAVHGSRTGDTFARGIVTRIEKAGLVPVIVSNARAGRARAYARSLGVSSFIPDAGKPGIEPICRHLRELGCSPDNALMIGDQLLTDVWSARRAGIPVILTDKRSSKELITVRVKRPIETLLRLIGGCSEWKILGEKGYDCL